MVKFPELLPDSVIERAMKLDVSQLCDGMKKLKVPFSGCMEAVISPVDPSFKVCGTAVTVETIAMLWSSMGRNTKNAPILAIRLWARARRLATKAS